MTFEMNEVEAARAAAWIKAHLEEAHGGKFPYAGAIGGSLTYEFTPTGIGTAVRVRCSCGASGDCTDVDAW